MKVKAENTRFQQGLVAKSDTLTVAPTASTAVKLAVFAAAVAAAFFYAINDEEERAQEPVVSLIGQGLLQGELWKSHSLRRPFAAFTAVPYASPPIGHLRFASPQPASPWEGIRDSAEHDMTSCPQMTFHEVTEGDEDCLLLNVFTPSAKVLSSNNNNGSLLPVIFFIHGGGFFTGDSKVKVYGPDYFMDEDVVLVVPHYRLGPLGFLTFEDSTIPSNLGLRDLVSALEWTRTNAVSFGGDPDNVSLMGQSAGSMLAQYLMLSPKAEGLFSSVISLSGPVIASYLHWDKRPGLYGRRLAKKMGCHHLDMEPQQVIDCLRKLPSVTFAEQTQFFLHYPWTGPNVWKPVPDSSFSDDPVLPEDPETLLRQGRFSKVPILTGLTTDEGAFHLGGNFRGIISFKEIEERWDELGPLILFHRSLDEISETDVRLARSVRDFYFSSAEGSIDSISENFEYWSLSSDGGNSSNDPLAQYVKLVGDPFYLAPLDRMNRILLESPDAPPVFQYLFSHSGGPLSTVDVYTMSQPAQLVKVMARKLLGWKVLDRGLGVAHADEMTMLFRPHALPFPSRITPEDEEAGTRMVRLIANFARTKNPTPSDEDNWSHFTEEWLPLNSFRGDDDDEVDGGWARFLNITGEGGRLTMTSDPELERRVRFWRPVLDELRPPWSDRILSQRPVLTRQEYEEKKRL